MKRKIRTPEWVHGRTLYEVNIRQYTPEGTFKAFENHLPRLKTLGIGILWIMPVQPIGEKNRKGSLGSYYSVSNYTAVNPEFGSLEDLKTLVQKAQEMDMKVIIDWVANHTAWDHHWTEEHPEFYSKDEQGQFKAPVPEWEDVIHLDYGNPDLWDTMIDAMIFWINEVNVDGFRCDMALLVPTLFWNRVRHDLDKIKPVYMLAESQNHDLLEYAFDSIYNWKLLHAFNDLVSGSISPNDLIELAMNEIGFLPDGASLLNFTSNHDENSWQGSAIERLHYYLEPLTILTFLLKGIPLIYSGQESGNYQRLKFFDKDVIEWKKDKMFPLFQKVAQLRCENPSVWKNGVLRIIPTDAAESIIALLIEDASGKVMAILNLSDRKQDFYIKCQNLNIVWYDMNENNDVEYNCHDQQNLEAFSYKLLYNFDTRV